jgi:hypothetical protein
MQVIINVGAIVEASKKGPLILPSSKDSSKDLHARVLAILSSAGAEAQRSSSHCLSCGATLAGGKRKPLKLRFSLLVSIFLKACRQAIYPNQN